jgi:hypothetical protein
MHPKSIMNTIKQSWIKIEPYVLIGGFSAVVIYGLWSLWYVGLLIFTGRKQ